MWIDPFGVHQYGWVNVPVTLVSGIEAELLTESLFLSPNGDAQHDTGVVRWSTQSDVTAPIKLEASGFDDSGAWSRSFTLVDGESFAMVEHELPLDGTDDAQASQDGPSDPPVHRSTPGPPGLLLAHNA